MRGFIFMQNDKNIEKSGDKNPDYRKIFNENIITAENDNKINKNNNYDRKDNPFTAAAERTEKIRQKEKKYIATFLVQSLICLLIIGSIIIAKYTTPKTFVSVSAVLNGLYDNNITLSDLNRLIDEKIMGSDTLAAFFNMNGN